MISFPNCVGQKQEVCVFPTPCPNECNVCPPTLCAQPFQHACICAQARPLFRQACMCWCWFHLYRAEDKLQAVSTLPMCSALRKTLLPEWTRGVEIIYRDKLKTRGNAASLRTDTHQVCAASRSSGTSARPVGISDRPGSVSLLPSDYRGQVTEFLQAWVCLSINQGK